MELSHLYVFIEDGLLHLSGFDLNVSFDHVASVSFVGFLLGLRFTLLSKISSRVACLVAGIGTSFPECYHTPRGRP